MTALTAPLLSRRSRWVAVGLVMLLFLVPAIVCILLGVVGNAQYHDARNYHLPTAHLFASQWPNFNFRSYPAAMTPGYHLFMAALLRAGSCDMGLALATAGLSAGLIGTLAWVVSSRVRTLLDTLLLCLPVAWSPYILPAGIYVVPHNFAWWAVLVTILLAIRGSQSAKLGTGFYAASAVALVWVVLARQIQVWVFAAVVMAVWVAPAPGTMSRRLGRVGLAVLAAAPAALVLGYFVRLWGGLTPPDEEWVHPAGGVNLASLAMMLASLGFVGVWFLPRFLTSAPGRPAMLIGWGLAGAVLAFLVAVMGPTTYDVQAGRWSGLWNLARSAPTIAERSFLIVGLAAVGGFVAGVLLVALPARPRWVIVASLAGFAAAHATIDQAWQRFYEPFMLITLVLASTLVPSADKPRHLQRLSILGLVVLEATLSIIALF